MKFDNILKKLNNTTKGSIDKISKKKGNKKFHDGGETDLGPSGISGSADTLKKGK